MLVGAPLLHRVRSGAGGRWGWACGGDMEGGSAPKQGRGRGGGRMWSHAAPDLPIRGDRPNPHFNTIFPIRPTAPH